jgi:hypothetical protein
MRKNAERKKNDGKQVDRPLPKGTLRVRKGLKRSLYDPNSRLVVMPSKGNRRVALHEKAHYIWDIRASMAQRRQFDRAVDAWAKKVGAKRKLSKVDRGAVDGNWGHGKMGEEMFALAYAEVKRGRPLHPDLKRAVLGVVKADDKRRRPTKKQAKSGKKARSGGG